MVAMRAVLWDMDGTLVDSEKLWDISMHALYERMGGVLTPEVRESTIGGSGAGVIRIVYDDLGLEPDPAAMTESMDWLFNYTGELFASGLPWRDGARELLEELRAADVPMALVTNTYRDLAEKALNSIGRQFFTVTVCGDEVPHGKPAPDIYMRAAELLGFDTRECLAVEDSVTGTLSAETAGCPVLVVPNEVEVPLSPRRKHVSSLKDLGVGGLRAVHEQLETQLGERTA